MKKIFYFLVFLTTTTYGQVLDGTLRNRAIVIRDEIIAGRNTPYRVGSMFLNLVESKTNLIQGVTALGTNDYSVTISSAVTAYIDGLELTIKIGNANTTSSTLNVNALGAKAIVDVASGDLEAGKYYKVVYNGTAFQLIGGLGGSDIEDVTGLQDSLSAKQPLDSDLTSISGLSPTNDDVVQRKAGVWTNRSIAQLKVDEAINNVDNTSDANKPVSTATQTALDGKQTLDSDLTSIAGLSPTNDDIIQRKAGAWTNRTITQVKTDLAINNVDNTSDANKPVSTAQGVALDLKGDKANPLSQFASTTSAQLAATLSNETGTGLAVFSDSPTLTGTPLAPTQAITDNSTKIATTAHVNNFISPPTLGTIITETWANLTNWTNVGSGTFSVAGNVLTVNGGTPASITLTNYRTNTGYGTSNLEKTTLNATLTIGTINATSHGVGFGYVGSTSLPYMLTAALITNSGANRGKIGFYINNSLTAAITTSASMTINASDVIQVRLRQVKDKVIVTFTNTTTAPGTSISAEFPFNFSSTLVAGTGAGTPNSYYYSIYALGGTHTLATGYSISSDEVLSAELMHIGNSVTKGYSTGLMTWRASDVLNENYQGFFSVNAGPSSRLSQINTAEVLAHTPKRILISGGESDKILSDLDGTVQTALTNLVNAFVSGGYVLGTNLFITTLRPNNTVSVAGVNTYIRSTYPTSYIELYTPLWSGTSTNANPTYFVDDLVHYSKAGAALEASILANYFGFKPLKYTHLNFNPVVYNPNGNVSIGQSGKYTQAVYPLTVIGSSGTKLKLSSNTSTSADDGAFLVNTNAQDFYSAAGASYNGSAWVAKSTTAAILGQDGTTGFLWFLNTGLTPGNTFTPTQRLNLTTGGFFIGGSTTPTDYLHIAAGSTSIAPIRVTSGALPTGGNIRAGQFGMFLTDKFYGTITTGTAIKEFTLNDAALTLGVVPVTTTNGRLTDSGITTSSSGTVIPATNTNDAAASGKVGEEINSTVSTYTNFTTTATYQAITSITLTAGDWDISAFATYSSNSSTITAASNAIFVISTTTASASGATEGVNIMYVPQAALLGTSKFTDTITPYRVSISGSTTYYLNAQATFTVGNPQFVGSIRARRMR